MQRAVANFEELARLDEAGRETPALELQHGAIEHRVRSLLSVCIVVHGYE